MNYAKNKLAAITKDDTPTLTDQSQAKATDINVIVKSFKVTGRVPGSDTPPIAGDFTALPTDLRGMIETSRELQKRRRSLPPQLRELPIEELLSLTPDKLTNILTPPQLKTEEPKT